MTEQSSSPYRKQELADAEFAELSESCREKLQEWERELNKQGCWNIALVAYQLKG